MMYTMQNPKMPSARTVRVYLITAFVLALLSGIFAYTPIFTMLAVSFASVALLSIPRMTYARILLVLSGAAVGISAIVFLLTRNTAFCFAAAAFAPATAFLTLTIRKRYSRTCGIILAAIGLGIFYLACYLIAIYTTYHRLSLDLFKELYASMEETYLTYANQYLSSALGELQDTLNEEVLLETFRLTMTLLPSILIDFCLATVWLSTVILRLIFKNYLYGADRFADWKVTMNRSSAAIFLLTAVLAVLPFPESVGWLSAVFFNLLLILTPGFICVGCSYWKARFFRPGRRIPIFMIFLFVLLLLFLSPFLILYFIALSGAMQLLFPKTAPSKPQDTPWQPS